MGFRSGVAVLLENDAAALGNFFPTFRESYVVSKSLERNSQCRGVIYQKKGYLNIH